MTYDQWRITYQSGNQAAQAAWVELCKVTKERDELKAHCEALTRFVDETLADYHESGADEGVGVMLLGAKLLAQSPKQSLMLHNADVIDAFIDSAISEESKEIPTAWDFSDVEIYSQEVTTKLRAQAKDIEPCQTS